MPKECCWFEEMFPTELSVCLLRPFKTLSTLFRLSYLHTYITVVYCWASSDLGDIWGIFTNYFFVFLDFTFYCWWPKLCTALWNRIRTRIHLALLDPDLDPYWYCGSGSGSRSKNIDWNYQIILNSSLLKGLYTNVGMFNDYYLHKVYLSCKNSSFFCRQSLTRIRIRVCIESNADPHHWLYVWLHAYISCQKRYEI